MKRRLFILLGVSNLLHWIGIMVNEDKWGNNYIYDPQFDLMNLIGLGLLLVDALVNGYVFFQIFSSYEQEYDRIKYFLWIFLFTTIFARINLIVLWKADPDSPLLFLGVLSPYFFGKLLEIQQRLDEPFLRYRTIRRYSLRLLEYYHKFVGLYAFMLLFDLYFSEFIADAIEPVDDIFFEIIPLVILIPKLLLVPLLSGLIFMGYGFEKDPEGVDISTFPQAKTDQEVLT